MKITSALILVFFTLVTSNAQSLSSELVEATGRIHNAFDQNLKGWTRKNIEPIKGNANVVVENWTTYDRGVRMSISILPADTNNDDWMTERLRETGSIRLDGVGDVAVASGYAKSLVSFHRGRFAVFVSTIVQLNLLSKNKDENRALSELEASATSRLIGCFINLALSGDLARPIPREGFLQRPCEQELLFKGFFGEDILNQLCNR